MLRRTAHPIISGLAILAVFAYGVLPAEHVHATHDHEGHRSEFVHRHFEPHHQSAPDTAVGHDDDDPVRWLTTAFTASKTAAHARVHTFVVGLVVPIPSAERHSHAAVAPLFVSVHDPPWATASGLRAPPASRLLV